jgi:hypothetical protein
MRGGKRPQTIKRAPDPGEKPRSPCGANRGERAREANVLSRSKFNWPVLRGVRLDATLAQFFIDLALHLSRNPLPTNRALLRNIGLVCKSFWPTGVRKHFRCVNYGLL